jgi:hypothetical protein
MLMHYLGWGVILAFIALVSILTIPKSFRSGKQSSKIIFCLVNRCSKS